jgi:hypothetical protein
MPIDMRTSLLCTLPVVAWQRLWSISLDCFWNMVLESMNDRHQARASIYPWPIHRCSTPTLRYRPPLQASTCLRRNLCLSFRMTFTSKAVLLCTSRVAARKLRIRWLSSVSFFNIERIPMQSAMVKVLFHWPSFLAICRWSMLCSITTVLIRPLSSG